MTERYVLASKVEELRNTLGTGDVVVTDPYTDGCIDTRADVCRQLAALLASAVELPELAEKEKELTVAREYLAHMHNTEECLAKTIAENEELTVTLASLKARCEGMREAIEKFIREYVVCPDDDAVVCPVLEDARMEMKATLAAHLSGHETKVPYGRRRRHERCTG